MISSKTTVLIANILATISAIIYTPLALLAYGIAHVDPNDGRYIFLFILIYPASTFASVRYSRQYCKAKRGRMAVWVSLIPLLMVLSAYVIFKLYVSYCGWSHFGTWFC